MRENRRSVIEKFKLSSFYAVAIRKLDIQEAREVALYKKRHAMKLLIKSRKLGWESVIVIIKILIPKFLIR
jgi:hypothetical protein